MRNKNLMKTIKNWLAFGITIVLLVVLFGVIFITLDLATPGPSFFLELAVIICLSLIMRVFWYDFAEDKRLGEDDLKLERDKYFQILDDTVKDTNDLDKYLTVLNEENRAHYIKNKIGSRTVKNLAKKTKWMCFWHPSYKKLKELEIGQLRYDKLYFKIQRKADKLPQIKSSEIMALSDTALLYDAKNYAKTKKRRYQITSTILTVGFSVLLASIAFKEIMVNWTNVFRYITYLFSIISTISMTVIKAYRTTGEETQDWFNRLKNILDKYACYKAEEVKKNGDNG